MLRILFSKQIALMCPGARTLAVMKQLLISTSVILGACAEVSSDHLITDAQRKNAIATSDVEELRYAINAIEQRHNDLETGLQLNEGASSEEIGAIEEALDCKLPIELRQLWEWRNGERTESFLWYHRFLSTKDAVVEFRSLRSNEWGEPWRLNWIPVFEFQEEWYGVECGKVSTIASPVIHYFVEEGPKIAYSNLTSYMKTMAEAMVSGAITWDGVAWSDNGYDLSKIHAKHNLGIKFPYYVPDDG